MILLLHTLPASLTYNTTLGFMLGYISIQRITYLFSKMFYCSNDNYMPAFSVSLLMPSFMQSSFNFLLLLLVVILIWLINYLRKNSLSISKLSISIIILLTTISFISPMFSFIFTSLIMGIMLILLFPYKIYDSFFDTQKTLIKKILIVLEDLGILDFLATLYIMFFCVPAKIFKIRLLIMFIISIAYIITTRYCFIHILLLHEKFSYITYIFIYFMLFIGISLIYFRFLINLALFIVPLALRLEPKLLSESVLYVFGEEQDMQKSQDIPVTSPAKPRNRLSFINITVNRSTYQQHFTLNNPKSFRNFGIGLGLFTLGATSYAAYCSKIQADAAIIQANAALAQVIAQEVNNKEMARQNDLEEVAQGLMSKDDYIKKYEKLP